MFALVDCNNFYASCERVFNPILNNQPVAILSNNDGCVIARSNEAKALGIPMGAPAFKYQKIFEQHRINVFSSNYALYGDMSARVMNLLSEFTPDIEIYSIDEAFLQFIGYETYFNFQKLGEQMKKRVENGTGIPISIGVAPTKALAKVANRIAKKFPQQTKGIYILRSEEQRIKALKWLSIEDVWGIGRQHAILLQKHNINTAYHFTQLHDDWVRKHMSVVGLRLKKELEGKPSLGLEEVANKKAIATTRSFDTQYEDYEYIKERISSFAISCGEKMRKQNSCCQVISVFLRTNQFQPNAPQYGKSIVVKTPYPTNSSIDLVKSAIQGFNRIYKKGFQYKKAGVIVMGLTPENNRQLALFNQENPKHRKLMLQIDQLNKSLGNQKIKFACQDLQRTWKMRQERLSQRYTTNLNEIITANC
jgi:DNA polymerase V